MDQPKAPPKSMADRHRDEIKQIITDCEDRLMHHKNLAYWDKRAKPGEGPPAGWSLGNVGKALKAIGKARAQCSKDIADACERHRAEANAPPANPAA